MKRACLLILVVPLMAFHPGKKILKTDADFQRDSYFREQVYTEHDWKSFSLLPEIQRPVSMDSFDLHLLNAAVFYASNQLRESQGRSALKFLPELRDAAACHSRLMAQYRFFSHHNPYQPPLSVPEKRLACFGVKPNYWGENIALRYGDEEMTYWEMAQAVVRDWYNSPGHRKNLLHPAFRYLGCAASFSFDKKWGEPCIRFTQDFCGAATH